MASITQEARVDEPPHTSAVVLQAADLAEYTRDHAGRLYDAVAQQYLAFRREYYHEDIPDLIRPPVPHGEIRHGELAGVAYSVLRLVPQSVRSVPVVGGFLEHLQQVADMHSISEQERAELHNMSMLILQGVQGGIQSWYVNWLLMSARNLASVESFEYYLDHPWDALLYRSPAELRRLEVAVRDVDQAALEAEVERLATRLIEALKDPIKMHAELAFTGPRAERQKVAFQLKTTASLALGTYLIVEQVQQQLHPHRPPESARSRLAPLPDEIDTSVLCAGH